MEWGLALSAALIVGYFVVKHLAESREVTDMQ
jgi:hypothetical protein